VTPPSRSPSPHGCSSATTEATSVVSLAYSFFHPSPFPGMLPGPMLYLHSHPGPQPATLNAVPGDGAQRRLSCPLHPRPTMPVWQPPRLHTWVLTGCVLCPQLAGGNVQNLSQSSVFPFSPLLPLHALPPPPPASLPLPGVGRDPPLTATDEPLPCNSDDHTPSLTLHSLP
jgi:hypothetical protein